MFEITYTAGIYASTPTTLVSFNVTDGATPFAGLIADAAGDLFGATYYGGANGDGTVFEIAKTRTGYASTPTTLVNFNMSDGEYPYGGLIADAAGDLFGTTEGGGALTNAGTVFEIAKTSTGYANTPTTLVGFNGADGSAPSGGLIADAAGNLLGTTQQGGANGDGTVFKIAKTSTGYASTPTTLVTFNGANGIDPIGGLIADAAGDLFGTTQAGGGGLNAGTVFEIAKIGGVYASTPTTLITFNDANGFEPGAGLIADAAGNLFGTTRQGGANGDGTVFEVVKSGGSYASTPTTLVSFNYNNGKDPYGGLIADTAGQLFGTTIAGGANDYGTAFELSGTGFVTPVVTSGQILVVSSGETTTGITVQSQGTLIVANGGTTRGTALSGGSEIVSSGGTASGGTVTSGGKQIVESGGVASGGAVKHGGIQTVFSGGTARATVLSGGTEAVSSGGTASGTIVDSGGNQYLYGRAYGGTIASFGREIVEAGGVASGVTVRAGGSQIVFSGGTARATVLSGGAEIVSAGGTASATIVDSGGSERVYGRASGGTVNSGGQQIVESGGVAIGATVKHGGSQTVFSSGTARATVLSGGAETVHGTASGGTVDSGGAETVYGKASGGTINGGLIEVASGGTASGTVTFVSGGTLQLDATTGFTGAIKGFGKPDLADRIDLRGIAFGTGTKRSFTEAPSTTSGTLTVTDGTHTVHLTLLGSYTTSNFTLSTDNHGGTRVTDPPVAGGAARTTFADIAPAGPHSGTANPGNSPSYLPGAIGTNGPDYTGQILLAIGPPGGHGGDHNPQLPAPR